MTTESTVAIIGAGPRGVGVLERLISNTAELLGTARLHIHLVDPYPPGAGRVWRANQPDQLWLNVPSDNVTMFTDDTVECDGPDRPGPSLQQWLDAGAADLEQGWQKFASRRVHGRYLEQFFNFVTATRPSSISISVHAAAAVDLDSAPGGQQVVSLAGSDTPILADVVVLAIGHLDVQTAPEASLSNFAANNDLLYVPPSYAADVDLAPIQPGESVLVRGTGLSFFDYLVLLTEGRGGRFAVNGTGLAYIPSGLEPKLYVGSRRGLPHHAKFTYEVANELAATPEFFRAGDFRHCAPRSLDFRSDLWGLICKEVAWHYYRALFATHPCRVDGEWNDFSARYAALHWNTGELEGLLDRSVRQPSDRLSLESLNAPLAGAWFDSGTELQENVRRRIAADIVRRSSPGFGPELAVFRGLQICYRQIRQLLSREQVTARSMARDVVGWWSGFYDYFGSGPPLVRAQQLLALSRAGIVMFLGAGMAIAEGATGFFIGSGVNSPLSARARALIDARIPSAASCAVGDLLIQSLVREGKAHLYEPIDSDGFKYETGLLHVSQGDFRILDSSGNPCPSRFALGPFTNVPDFVTFTRPRSNAISFRQNDALARTVLRSLSDGQT